jgi:hypothetical protein
MDKLSDTDIDRLINGGACADNGSSEQESGKREKKERVADKLIKIAVEKSYRDEASRPEAGGLFHTPDKVAYADIEAHGWRETWPVRSRGFRHWLVRVYYETTGTAPNSEALQTALALAEARAFFDGPRREVYTRVGGTNGKIYIDLANEHWQAIEISSTGWQVLDSKQVPVRFRRAPGMLPLPEPRTGGSVDDLRLFLNVKSDDDFELALAWLLAAMRDRGPYPVLALMGEQGSAKSSFATILRSLVDPNTAALRSFPREDRDLFIAASNSWIVGYDNVSRIPSWLSDALCRLATGGGFSTRKLYTDDEEQLFNAQRPVSLNGIEDFVNRPDLADRTIFLTLDPIPEDRRKTDQALQGALDQVRARVLGALLNLIVFGLQRLPHIKLARHPRMADFALWGTACERQPGAFMRAYDNNRASAVEIVLEADLVATAVRALMKARADQEWIGTAAQLLSELTALVDEGQRRGRDWPSAPNLLSGRLRRAATNLRKVGIEIAFEPGHRRGRLIHIATRRLSQPEKEGKTLSSSSSPSSGDKKPNGANGVGEGDAGTMGTMDRPPLCPEDDTATVDRPPRPQTVLANPLKNSDGNDGGDGDDDLRTQSGNEPVCRRCGVPATEHYGALIECGHNGSAGLFHARCWTDERTKGPLRKPALGPPGDSLDDLTAHKQVSR